MLHPTTTPLRRHPRRLGTLGVALVAVLAACNGDDDATPISTTTAPTPVASEPATSVDATPPPTSVDDTAPSTASTAPNTTTGSTSTTTPSTTTPSTTTPSTSSTGPTSTTAPIVVVETDPDSPEVQQMLADFEVHFAAFTALLRDPTDARTVDAVLATATGEMTTTIERTIELLDERHQVAIPNPAVPTRVIVTDESIVLFENGAGFDACLVDGETLVDRDAVDPVPSEPSSRSVTYGLARIDGRWLVADVDFFSEFEGQVGCG